MATRTVDELIVLAVQTDTSLRIFDGEVLVIPGPDLDVSTLPEFHEARCLIAQRLVELFGAENFPIEVGDPDEPELRRRSPQEAEAERQEANRREAYWRAHPSAPSSCKRTPLPIPPRRMEVVGSTIIVHELAAPSLSAGSSASLDVCPSPEAS